MPVDSRHEEHRQMADRWKKCRDVITGGEEKVKIEGKEYLPQLGGQDTDEYNAYLKRAPFFPASGRTREGLVGAIMRKSVVVDAPKKTIDALKTVGRGNESLEIVIQRALDEVMEVGRVGHLVDVDSEDGKPYVARYFAENIINWDEVVVNDRRQPTMIALAETREVPKDDDPWVKDNVRVVRVLRLGTSPAINVIRDKDGNTVDVELAIGFVEKDLDRLFYFQEVYVEVEDERSKEKKWELEQTIVPRKLGGGLWDLIPFEVTNTKDRELSVGKPPLLDLVNVNLSHYTLGADYRHGLHFTALPTPWVAGFDPKDTVLKIGSGTAWISKDPDASAGMLEFSGAGMSAIADGMSEQKKEMAALGGRLLEEQTPGVEAAATVQLRHSGEQSALATIANLAGDSITQIVRYVVGWTQPMFDVLNDSTIKVTLNSDFNLMGIETTKLQALMLALQGGTISWDTWIYNLIRGEVLPEGVTAEIEAGRILEGPPGMPGLGAPDDEIEDEEIETGEGGDPPHTHKLGPNDSETSEVNGHRHKAIKKDGKITLETVNDHTHPVPDQAPSDG